MSQAFGTLPPSSTLLLELFLIDVRSEHHVDDGGEADGAGDGHDVQIALFCSGLPLLHFYLALILDCCLLH